MRASGALSPATAQRADELPPIVQDALERYLFERLIHEGPAGRYYLHEARAAALIRRYVLKAVSFWFLVIIIPVVILQLSAARPTSP